ncbi:hypothetical protein EH31_05245 [Erythrobacter longus]|uniref:Autotransporter domain-containing protein n=1 Tax=Erythrobacter longus TaxID=1044 RepID=A0A074MJP1_ERYLO|nr:autotransporter domain-containing protein [Erythrobacter longus]KEO92078.1 hypothetical protein EH31_05245 [Erythrobacter longus]
MVHLSKFAQAKWVGVSLASLAACMPQGAFAQSYGSFGDNIADPGNIPNIIEAGNQANGTNDDPNFPPSPPGFGNRFSNGRTAAEILPELLDFNLADISNEAVGNAFSDKLPVSLAGGIFLGNGSSIPGPIGRGLTSLNDTDIASQVDNYLARVGSLGEGDVMLLYASGNDAALALNTAALTMAPPDQAAQLAISGAQANAANTAASAQRLLDAGAGTVLVSNLPNIGQTPAARAGGLSGVQLATLFSTTTNQGLVTSLSGLNTGDGTLLLADTFTLTNDIAANPAKYGFSDVTNPCSLVPTCVNADRSVQDQFLFWDVFFPTARGHEISAAFLADTINAPRTLPALTEVSRFATEEQARSLLRLEGDGLWVAGRAGYNRMRRTRDTYAVGYEADGPGAQIALGYTLLDSFTVGVALGYSDTDVDFDFVGGGFDKRSLHISGFATVETPFVDLSAAISYGSDDIENLARITNVAGQTSVAETEGDSMAVVFEASRSIAPTPIFTIRPTLRVGYSESDVDGFTESGATGLSQVVSDLTLDKTFAEVGARVQAEFAGIDAHLSGFYHVRLGGGSQQVDSALVTIPDFTRSAIARAGDRDYGRVEGGLSKTFGKVQIGVNAAATFADSEFSHIGGNANVTVSF